ncbi:MAG TPA: Holliday junction branch migration DNA helicase RuvB, partial [Lachnospiraceae bacterium]|nr:Holliday junction branch migration DNA helicase RuvB [Lachnospiraceae bacterium]
MSELEDRLERFGRLVAPNASQEEKEAEKSLRPQTFDD